MFSLVEREALKRFGVSMEGFRDKRVCAERTARELSDREEISFGEIYDQLPYEEEIKSSLSQLELEMEYALTTVNLEIKEVYKYAIDRGKEVIIVSDMYLDRAFIERLLLKCGYNQYKKIYVSSETGVQKYTGNMYRMILRENVIQPRKNSTYRGCFDGGLYTSEIVRYPIRSYTKRGQPYALLSEI